MENHQLKLMWKTVNNNNNNNIIARVDKTQKIANAGYAVTEMKLLIT